MPTTPVEESHSGRSERITWLSSLPLEEELDVLEELLEVEELVLEDVELDVEPEEDELLEFSPGSELLSLQPEI